MLQLLNAELPIDVTPSGITSVPLRFKHPEKVEPLIDVILLDIIIPPLKPEHLINADFPMFVMLSGIIRSPVKFEQPVNAHSPIEVISLLNNSLFNLSAYCPHGAEVIPLELIP